MARLYYPGLNGIRALAAILVLYSHVEGLKEELGVQTPIYFIPYLDGPFGVTLFFVLSGFLITSLLIKEKEKAGDIHLPYFYMRRILRIWPLYYFVVFLGFFVFPLFLVFPDPSEVFEHAFFSPLALYVGFVPFISQYLHGVVPCIGPLWSVAIEEHFYLFWPCVLRKCWKYLLPAFLGIIVLFKLSGIFWRGLPEPLHTVFFVFAYRGCFISMVVGAIGAYIAHFHNNAKWYSFLLSRPLVLAALVLSFSGGFSLIYFGKYLSDLYAVCFTILVMHVALAPKKLFTLEGPVLNFLGKISYGIYLYHSVVAANVVYYYSQWRGLTFMPWDQAVIYILTLTPTLAVSWLSYEYLEKGFLRLKERFAIVLSGRPA